MHRSALAFSSVVLAASVWMLWRFVASEPTTTHASWEESAATRAASDIPISHSSTDAPSEVVESAGAARESVGLLTETDAPRASSAGAAKARIVGRVLDPAGNALADADVWASSSSYWSSLAWSSLPLDIEPEALPRPGMKRAHTRTDTDGRYVFESLASGPLRVVVRARGRVPARPAPISVPAGYQEFQVPDLALAVALAVSGNVVDEAGQGVAGAQVLLAVDGAKSRGSVVVGRGIVLAHTAAAGSFVVDEIAPGPFQLIVDAPGYRVGTFAGRAGSAPDAASPVVIQLVRGAEIRGVVRGLDATRIRSLRISARRAVNERDSARLSALGYAGEASKSEQPIAPSSPDVRARDALCDAEGRFAIPGLADGVQYRLTAWTRTEETQDWKRLEGADMPVVRAGELHAEIRYTPLSSLVLRVVDGATRAPVETFTIWAGVGSERLVRNEINEARREHPGGRVRCADLRTQKGGKPVELRISAAGYKDHTDKDVDLLPGVELDLGDIALERSAVLRVQVVAEATGEAIAGARVWLTTKDVAELAGATRSSAERDNFGDPAVRVARTNASGEAVLSAFPGRAAWIAASAPGFAASEPHSVTLGGDADRAHAVRLRRSGSVLVHVSDPSQVALAGVRVQCRLPRASWNRSDSGASTWLETDGAGDARFENLVPGSCSFRAQDLAEEWDAGSDDDGNTSRAWIEALVIEGELTRVELPARSRGSIRGRVSEAGAPLAGAHLRLVDARAVQSGDAADRDWDSAENPFAAVADDEGRYEYAGIPCGNYVIFVSHPARRMAARFELSIQAGSREIDFYLDAARIEGRVSDIDGRPLGGAEVRIARADPRADPGQPYGMIVQEDERGFPRTRHVPIGRAFEKTDRQGRFALTGVAADEPLELTVRADGYESKASEELVLAPDEVRRGIEFVLRPAGCIAVTLTADAPEASGPNARERWYDVRAELVVAGRERERVASAQVSISKRTVVLCSLAPGHYRLVCAPRGKAGAAAELEVELDVASGETTNASFRIQ